jgi:uncharacterized membrane protein
LTVLFNIELVKLATCRTVKEAGVMKYLMWLGSRLRIQFIAGILTIVPIGATALILYWIFDWVDRLLQPAIQPIAGREIPGLGFGIMVLLIYLTGVIVSNVLGRRLLLYVESLLSRAPVPLVPQLYKGIKQIVLSFSEPGKVGFMQVVLVEFPRKGIRTLGFITNEASDPSGEKLFSVFIPTAPNPTSGYLQILREGEISRTKIPVSDALNMLASAGRVMPGKVSEEMFAAGLSSS